MVLSRRVILEEARSRQKSDLLAQLKEGQSVQGVVKNVVKYGAFIDLGGMDGLLHVSDMSWGRIQHPSDVLRVGDELTVKILKFDRVKERISLGLKQLTADPWLEAERRFPAGAKVTGKVVNVVDYGAFVEIEAGLEGLIHVTEMSWSGNVRQANQVLAEGQMVEAVVIGLDGAARKLALSLKRGDTDPWQGVAERFPVGAVIEGQVRTVADFGVFIGLEDGVDGLVHRKDLSWSKNPPRTEDFCKPGQTLRAMVLSVDAEKRRVALGVKQLTPDPWQEAGQRLSLGGLVVGRVTSVNEHGVFVEILDGVEGLVHADSLPSGQAGLEVGQEVQARVVELQPDKRRLALTLA